ncbi:MAG: DUF3857 domain-containing protein [Saprospiraceae bacterium]
MHFPSLFSLALCLFSAAIYGQKQPMKFGKIPAEDLAMTVYALDTSAAAVVLCDYGEITFEDTRTKGLGINFYRHKRIKLLKPSGFHEGDISISFYDKDRTEYVKGLKAVVTAPNGTETEVSKKDFFEEKVNDYWSRIRFTCPNLQAGAVIEYSYEIVSDRIFALPDWYFQEDIPVRWSEIRMGIPEWFNYVFLSEGGPFKISEQATENKQMNISGTGFPVKLTTYRFAEENLPALKKEPYITTMDDYYKSLRMQLSSVRYPNTPPQDVMSSWPEVAKQLLQSHNFGEQFQKKRFYDKAWKVVEADLSGLTATEKADKIYQFVCVNLQVEDGWGKWVRESLNDCFEKKSGRRNELNLLLIALMQEAGIEAHPVLVSTRDHGKMFDLYPFLDQFNHVLALAVPDGKPVLMDAGNPFRPLGYPGEYALNGAGWVVDKDNPQWISINPPSGSETYFLKMELATDGSLSGTVSMSSDGYSAVDEREQLHGSDDGGPLKKRLMKRFPDARVDSLSYSNEEELTKPLKAVATCHLANMATVNGDFIYMAPALLGSFQENPFKLEKREYPVDFPHPFKERVILQVAVPEGYAVEELPEPINLSLPNEGGSFKFQMEQQGMGIQLVSTVQINQLHHSPEEYIGLRNFFDQVAEKMGEQLVLKRIP